MARENSFSQESLLLLLFVLHSCLKPLLNSPLPGSSDEVSLEQESEDDIHSSHSSLDRQSHHRANTTMHVCWYRNTSVSMTDHSVAVEVPPGRSSRISLCPSWLARPPLHLPFRLRSVSASAGEHGPFKGRCMFAPFCACLRVRVHILGSPGSRALL